MCIGSKAMCTKATSLTFCLTINNVIVEFVNCTKNLGMYLDYQLDFCLHVNSKCKTAYRRLKYLYKFKYILPKYVKLKLVQYTVIS